MNIKEIKNARYLESGAIDCDVLFDSYEDYMPYTASADDGAETGQRVWQELQSGKYEIAPFKVTREMLEVAKSAKRREIEAWRTEQEAQPFMFEWKGRTWNAGSYSLARLSPVAIAAKTAKSRETFVWNDASNEPVPMTMAQAEELAAAMAQAQLDRNDEIYRRQRNMKDELDKQEDLKLIRDFVPE
ncbi:DUF4376 domain-containing protein [Salmonella enterica subsp. salamae serovar 13,22:z:-]|uniref:DUF4376 domain-containing protein n=1 Tax=Salmonella enterica TaxID=28901 RepID=UPI00103524ED|nr:DUF4376 domain-containing protein [Salmonella enterica]TBN95982.1 DUF4376 domain-containing protein [Salmonella enterica subsp. salamae serovar 13,22:z:-]